MSATRNEARKIIKNHSPTKYSNSVVLLLLRIVDLTYRKDKDNAEREVQTSAISLLKAAAVGEKQFGRILDQLTQDDVLKDVHRAGKKITCCLNLEPLKQLEQYGVKHETQKKEKAADRAAQARDQRQKLKDANRAANATNVALNSDMRDFTLKSELLKDVKDQNIKRMMMNWDIPRIQRAKTNAERPLLDVLETPQRESADGQNVCEVNG